MAVDGRPRRWAAAGVFLATFLVVLAVWGSLRAVPVVHDEASYLVQAKIFASGRWTAPARPLPEFFEQFHLLVTPVTASKYPPGHALLLAPGVAAGLPGLSPLLAAALAGALIFRVSARFLGTAGGAIAWFVWITSAGALRILPSYLSQVTSLALWLAAAAAFLRYLDTELPGWLMAFSAAVALDAINRPLSIAALCLPLGVILIRRARFRRALPGTVPALAIAVAVAAILPWQNVRTTGSAAVSPYSLYSRLYMPYDGLGFGSEAPKAVRSLPPDIERFTQMMREMVRTTHLSSLPRILAERLRWIAADVWGRGRWALAIVALAALPALGSFGLTAILCGVSLVLAYLAHVHPATSSVYAFEAEPVLAFLTASGALQIARRLGVARLSRRWRGVVFAAAGLAAAAMFVSALSRARSELHVRADEQRAFRAAVERLPVTPAIVFVRYGPLHDYRKSLIDNEPFLEDAPVWIVYDRGADDERLRRLAPGRAAYLFDEARHRLSSYPAAISPKSL